MGSLRAVPMDCHKKTPLLAWLLLFASLVISALSGLYQKQAADRAAAADFARVCDQITLKIEERLHAYALILRAGAGVFAASDAVSRKKWHEFVAQIHPEKTVPGVTGIGYAAIIPPDQLAAHTQSVRTEGFPGYRVWPEGERAIYTSILYLEPFKGRNLRAFGYDMYAEPVRRAAMELARDSGEAALSGKVLLVQESGQDVQAGVLMYAPVYRNGMPVTTLAQRQAALMGWVYSPYRMNDLMAGLLAPWQGQLGSSVHLNIYDGDRVDPGQRIYQSQKEDINDPRTTLFRESRIDFGGRQWLLVFDHHYQESVFTSYSLAWLVFVFGMTASIMLFLLLRSTMRTRENAVNLAQELTKEIRQSKASLEESEFRWKFALEGSGLGVWDWNIQAGKVFYSTRWKAMLGYAEDEIGDDNDEWELRLHPDDRQAVHAHVQACQDGAEPYYDVDCRYLCKDGGYKWIRDRGMVIERSGDGEPLRMIGTHSDITERKLLEASLRQHQAELEAAQRIAQLGSWTLELATGRVAWSAALYRMYGLEPDRPPPDYTAQAHLFTAESWDRLNAAVSRTQESGAFYELELEMIRVDGTHGWMLARGEAVRDMGGAIVGLRGIVMDISERKQTQTRIERLTKLYRALSACNSAIVHCTTQEELFAKVCQVVVQHGGMAMAWIGLVDAAGSVAPMESYGMGVEYLDGIEITVHADDPHGQGPVGMAIRENQPAWYDDFNSNPGTAPWHERGARFGWAACAALPIRLGDKPLGALTFYSTTSGWFDEETHKLLEEMAGDINFALDKLAAEAVAKAYQATLMESEQRYRFLVEQSIAGTFIIQDGKLVYANQRLVQILGYPDADELIGRTPQALVDPKDREYAGLALQKMSEGRLEKAELAFTMLRKDGAAVEIGVSSVVAVYQSRPAIIGLLQDISDKKVAEDQIRRYAQQLEHTFIQTVALATTLSEMRDPYTAGHEQRVAAISVEIGREMGLEENQLEGLRIGGYLHDVGKLSVPIEILVKPSKLTENEYLLIKGHPQAGYDVLKGVDFPWPVAKIALQHHERIDGSGYPQGLKGDEIILEARIAAVADVIESMASHRPYRPGLGIDAALAEIERGKGAAYDAQVVAACLRLFRDKGYVIPG